MRTRQEIIKSLYDDREKLFNYMCNNLRIGDIEYNNKLASDYVEKTKIIDAQIKVLKMMGDSL
jgi:hypothetical protein